MADTPPPENSPARNSTESPPKSPPPSSPPPQSPPPSSPQESSPPSQSPPASNNNDPNGGDDSPGAWEAPPLPEQPRTQADDRAAAAALKPPGDTPGRSSSNGSPVSVPLVAAVVVAGVVLFAFLLLFLLYRKKKNGQMHRQMQQYYRDNNHANVGRGQQRPNWQNTHKMMNNQRPSLGGWAVPPPPQPNTYDMSSATFSGPPGFTLLPPPPPPPMVLGFASQSSFTYEELAAATGGFSRENLLGEGGFGYVHKGVFPNGKEVAVKSLKAGSGQGEREFSAEVEIISRVHHRHLVSLVGYCISGDKRLLVYEFIPNNNLEFHLHGKGSPTMDFPTRLKIALGTAKGLAYLHEDCHPRIFHRDIKSSNILLDFNFDVKVSDFGLAKLNSENYTHVSTRVMGTFGYLAPEYASSGKLTEKSDVFSFGVMLLELITGRSPVDTTGTMEDSLVYWARPLCVSALENGNYDELADPFLEKNFSAHEMARMVACAAASISHSARRRPRMSRIVRALEGNVSLEDINDGCSKGSSQSQ